jgi:regulator of replication initiation timing
MAEETDEKIQQISRELSEMRSQMDSLSRENARLREKNARLARSVEEIEDRRKNSLYSALFED